MLGFLVLIDTRRRFKRSTKNADCSTQLYQQAQSITKSCQTTINALNSQVSACRNQLGSCQSRSSQTSSTQSCSTQLQNQARQISTLQSNVSQLTNERNTYRSQVSSLQSSISSCSSAYSTLQRERDQLKSQVSSMQTAISSCSSGYSALQRERDQYKSQVQAAQSERDGYKSALETVTSERDKYKAELEAAQKERDEYKGQLPKSGTDDSTLKPLDIPSPSTLVPEVPAFVNNKSIPFGVQCSRVKSERIRMTDKEMKLIKEKYPKLYDLFEIAHIDYCRIGNFKYYSMYADYYNDFEYKDRLIGRNMYIPVWDEAYRNEIVRGDAHPKIYTYDNLHEAIENQFKVLTANFPPFKSFREYVVHAFNSRFFIVEADTQDRVRYYFSFEVDSKYNIQPSSVKVIQSSVLDEAKYPQMA